MSVNTETAIKYGANTHFGLNYNVYNNDVGAVLDELVSIGMKAIRDNVQWPLFETSAGVYTFNPSGDVYSQNMFEVFAYIKNNSLDVHTTMSCLWGNSAVYADPVLPGGLAVWSDHFCDAHESMAQQYIAAGYDPALLTLELWNEPMGNFSSIFSAASAADDMAVFMQDFYARIKAVSSSIRVIGPATADAWWYRLNTGWPQGFWSTPGWTDMDAWSDHLYNSTQALNLRQPETLYYVDAELNGGGFLRSESGLDRFALADGKAKLPLVINEFGFRTNIDTDAVCAKMLPRSFAIYSALKNVQEVTVYELMQSPDTQYGICIAAGNRKVQANAIAAVLVHLNLATKRSYYRTGAYSTGLHAVILDCPAGQRLLAWSIQGDTATDIIVNSYSGGGTLSIQTIGGSTTTQGLTLGKNTVSLTLTDTIQALFADVQIDFPEFG